MYDSITVYGLWVLTYSAKLIPARYIHTVVPTYIHGLRSPTTLALIQKRDSAKTMNGAKGQDARVSKIDYIYYFKV